MSENCKSLVLQDKCNIEIFLSPASSNYEFFFKKKEVRLGILCESSELSAPITLKIKMDILQNLLSAVLTGALWVYLATLKKKRGWGDTNK